MMSRIQSFSISPSDTEAGKLLARIKKYCDSTGVTFSHIVMAALKNYAEEVLWPTKKQN
ncbi:MAG: hypothetical protein JHC33_09730 [Ignisphaera sp.]|nr:hypothetical protein [Ignisphaera sp.]